jgi:hypothetical protein
MITEKENLRIIRLNTSNYSVEFLYDNFEKLVDNTGITVGCVNKKLSAEVKMVQKNGVSNKEDPEMKINFTNVGKTMKRE